MSQRFTNVSDVPLALAVWLASDTYDYNDDPYTISATTLLKPLRQIILPSRIPPMDGLVSLPDQMNTRMGAGIHDSIERAWRHNYAKAMLDLGYPQKLIDRVRIDPTDQDLLDDPSIIPFYMEQRGSRKLGKWTVTGKWDFIGEGKVQDYKTASVWSYLNQVNADKQIKQGSIYRWLDPKKITQDEMDIHHIFMDWKAAMARSDPNYPKQRFMKQVFPLLSIQETENFIKKKIALIEQYWDADEDQIPLCNDEELWRSEPVFKYYKNPSTAKRSTKNFDNRQDAMLRFIEDGSVGLVKEVPGQVTACKYCASFPICSQKDALIVSGDLIMT